MTDLDVPVPPGFTTTASAYDCDIEETVGDLPETDTDVKLILGDPGRAFALATHPVDGVGLAREEFIVTSHVGSHPLELLKRDEETRFIDTLRTGIAKMAPCSTGGAGRVPLGRSKIGDFRD